MFAIEPVPENHGLLERNIALAYDDFGAGQARLLELADVPDVTKGTAMALTLAGLLSLTFMGFGGLGG